MCIRQRTDYRPCSVPAIKRVRRSRREALSSVFCPLSSERGIALIELIMFIVIVGVALAGILLVLNVAGKGSADPLIRKQALAAAESLLEEVQLQDFSPPTGAVSSGALNAADDRTAGYRTILNYHQFPLDDGVGIYPPGGGTPVAGLENYKVKVTVESPLAADWNGILAASAALITVTVTDPQNNPVSISGYRTDYCCSNLE